MKQYNKVSNYAMNDYVLREISKRREKSSHFLVSLMTPGERRDLRLVLSISGILKDRKLPCIEPLQLLETFPIPSNLFLTMALPFYCEKHGVKPLQEKRDIRELPLPSESAWRKDHVKTQ